VACLEVDVLCCVHLLCCAVSAAVRCWATAVSSLGAAVVYASLFTIVLATCIMGSLCLSSAGRRLPARWGHSVYEMAVAGKQVALRLRCRI
jgi:hypothetical protein